MRRSKELAVASAVAATFALAAHGQSISTLDPQTGIRTGTAVISDNQDDRRVFEAMRSAEQKRAAAPTAINTAELARARAAGEIKTAEGSTAPAREVVQLHMGAIKQPQMVNARAQLQSPRQDPHGAQTNSITADKGRPTGAIVYLPDPKPAGRPQITEAMRAAEHARYEANKRRRVAETASSTASEPPRARITEQARAGVDTPPALIVQSRTDTQPRAEIGWSESTRGGITANEGASAGVVQAPRTIARADANDDVGAGNDRTPEILLPPPLIQGPD